ncbi:MAG: STAS domain-containing protein [Candidatus Methylomirabilales bacterium]
MHVRWSAPHKVAVIDPQGRMDIRTMVEMKETMGSLLRDGCRTLILDCRGVERMQAMSLGVLVERLCRAREVGGTLALTNVHPLLMVRLQELRVDGLFPQFASVPQALTELTGVESEAVLAA